MKIGMVGCGYVGLVSGACLADMGNNVVAAETNKNRIKMLLNAEIPIYEPDLEAIVKRNLKNNRLQFVPKVGKEFKDANLIFLAVGTPTAKDSTADLTQFFNAATQVAKVAPKGAVIVSKSTVPMGTTRKLQQLLDELEPTKELLAAANPEFLREGSAVGDFTRPHRVVVGGENLTAINVLKKVYAPLAPAPILCCNWESAELIKYAANGFLATKITFVNEIADLASASGADIRHVTKGLGLDKRIGKQFLEPGPGYGGACLPKDVRAIIASAKTFLHSKTFAHSKSFPHSKTFALQSQNSQPTNPKTFAPQSQHSQSANPMGLMKYVNDANLIRKASLAKQVARLHHKSLKGERIAILGLTFKPQTDDIRESAAEELIAALIKKGAKIIACDPKANPTIIKRTYPKIAIAKTATDALKGADIAILLTHWKQYTELKPSKIKSLMKGNLFVDFRNGLDPDEATSGGLDYHCLGISKSTHNAHQVNPKILRAYDVRGVFGKEIFAEDGYHLARAFVTQTKCSKVAVCYDARLSSPQLEARVVQGIQHSGATAIRLGLGATPTLYQNALDIAGIMITASHNPKEYNGLKFIHNGVPVGGKEIIYLGKIVESKKYQQGKGKVITKDGIKPYIASLKKALPKKGLRIAWDCANASAATVIPKLVKHMAGKHFVIGGKVDGNFPLHHPDPEDPKNMKFLQKEVLKNQCDLGFTFDGDADRLGVVDNKGRTLPPQMLSAILIKDVLKQNKGAKIIVDIKSGKTVLDAVKRHKGRLGVSPCGHTNIKRLMGKHQAAFGAEMSGHIFFKDKHFGYDDGMYSALRFWEAVIGEGKSLADIVRQYPNLPMHKATFYCDDNEKFLKIKALKRVAAKNNKTITMDGVKCFQDGGWWLVRASNTEPKIMLAVEHENQTALKELTSKVLKLTKKVGIIFK